MEEHWVTTEDDYIIGMHRLEHGRNNFKSGKSKPAVFIAHGLLGNSGQWVFGPPEKSLGFILADAGNLIKKNSMYLPNSLNLSFNEDCIH